MSFTAAPPMTRIITFYLDSDEGFTRTKDPDATLFYWFDFSNIVGEATIASAVVTPQSGLTASLIAVNTAEIKDSLGVRYKKGTVVSVSVSGGSDSTSYTLAVQITLSTGEIDERTITVEVTNL